MVDGKKKAACSPAIDGRPNDDLVQGELFPDHAPSKRNKERARQVRAKRKRKEV